MRQTIINRDFYHHSTLNKSVSGHHVLPSWPYGIVGSQLIFTICPYSTKSSKVTPEVVDKITILTLDLETRRLSDGSLAIGSN
jgi:hypothetical protein